LVKEPAYEINTYMTILTINTGTSPNKGDGDSLRTAFNKINANFLYLSTLTTAGGGTTGTALGNIVITNSTISTTGTNDSIIFNPNGTGRVRFISTPIQFDNGIGGNLGSGAQILYTKGSGNAAGLATAASNSSLRIVGDKDTPGPLVDMGLYTGVGNAWASKVYVDTQGNVTATGYITPLLGIKFQDGSIQTNAVSGISVSAITTATISNLISNVTALRFDTESGFALTDLGSGAVKVGMNSTFKYWEVTGQPTLTAEGLDHVQFIAGSGIAITTDNTSTTQSITIRTTGGGGNLGNINVDGTTFYANSNTLGVVVANRNIQISSTGASVISLPALTDIITPLSMSSPNEIRINTSGGNNPIGITNGGDGFGGGYIAIGNSATTSTSGMFLYSAGAEINFWPNPTIAKLISGNDAGTLDLYTYDNGDISLRPNGTGTVVVTGPLILKSHLTLSVHGAGAGGIGVTTATYQANATILDETLTVHKLLSYDYYLPNGDEGSIIYFTPKTSVPSTGVNVWVDRLRKYNYITTQWVETTSSRVTVFVSGNSSAHAIFTDNCWCFHGDINYN